MPYNYTAASGTTSIYGGKLAPTVEYPWAAALLTTNDQWFEIPGTNAKTAALAMFPAGAYIGNDPFGSLWNAFCDSSFQHGGEMDYAYGEGHGDGTMNGVMAFNRRTLTYSLEKLPTPPSKYTQEYGPQRWSNGGTDLQPGSPIRYQSNSDTPGYFSANPIYGAEAAPFNARASSHMYAAACYCSIDNSTRYFYGVPATFNHTTKEWSQLNHVDYGAQLAAFDASMGTGGLQWGTYAEYDEVTDKCWVTIVKGDLALGIRNHIARIDRATSVIEAVYQVPIESGATTVRVGRWLYTFRHVGGFEGPYQVNAGFRILMDAPYTMQHTQCVGTPIPLWTPLSGSEVYPMTYHPESNQIYRIDFGRGGNQHYVVNPTPIGGTGTSLDPLQLQQTLVTKSNTLGVSTAGIYRRGRFAAGTNILMVLPEADSNWQAMRISI